MTVEKPWSKGVLKVSENKRYLQNGDTPFFWLGDTAWLLFEKLTKEEMKEYLLARKEQGYTVIQASLMHTTMELVKQESHWEMVDEIIQFAGECGMYMALLPCWGSYVKNKRITMEEVIKYTDFLGDRYHDYPNIIWVVGGDVRGSEGMDMFNTFGESLRRLCPNHLVAFHPFGRTSSTQWFKDAKWLDFNMFQSGHRRYDQARLGLVDDNTSTETYYGEDNWRYVEYDYQVTPQRPTLDGEPSYEEIPQGLHDTTQPYWQDYDVRRYAYWSVLQGALGHTYGHNSIMQFYRVDGEPGAYGAKTDWRLAVHAPGGSQMKYLKELMSTIGYQTGAAAQYLLSPADRDQEEHERISVFANEEYTVFYNYTGRTFSIEPEGFTKKLVEANFLNPEDGSTIELGKIDLTKEQTFQSPKDNRTSTDWVLVLHAIA